MAKFLQKSPLSSPKVFRLWRFWRRETRFWHRVSLEMSPADWAVCLRFALAFATLLLSAELLRQHVVFWAAYGVFVSGCLFLCHVMRWAVDDSAICLLLYKVILSASLVTLILLRYGVIP
ncbi:hypothetical protein Q0M94_08445 [Deinococcus radiomollis]|uniref:hypothetical protein n=1 Tax=Deinococcus radiomollis TaxID=468916 RepID=UPI00389231D8